MSVIVIFWGVKTLTESDNMNNKNNSTLISVTWKWLSKDNNDIHKKDKNMINCWWKPFWDSLINLMNRKSTFEILPWKIT